MIKNSVTIMDINQGWFPSKYANNTKIERFCPDLASENNIVINIHYVEHWRPLFHHSLNKKILDFIEKNKSIDIKIIFELPRQSSLRVSEVLNKIHSIIDESSIDYKSVYLLTGCIDIKQSYENWLEQNNKKYKINIIVVSNWENELKLFSNPDLHKYVSFLPIIKPKKFLCFNRRNRSHRFACVMMLQHLNLIKHGYISFDIRQSYENWLEQNNKISQSSSQDQELEITNIFNEIQQEFKNDTLVDIINNSYEKIKSELPYKLNNSLEEKKYFLKIDDIPYFKNSYFSLVTETVFFEDNGPTLCQNSLSEKTFKPIFMKHPFILMAWPGALKHLKKLGYKTFEGLIDESYDLINNPSDRFLAIIKEVERLCQMTDSELENWQKEIQPIVEYNFQHFFSKTQPQDYILEQITAELL